MGRIWILDTETKGTGAEMVPLDTVLKKPGARSEPRLPAPKRKPRDQTAAPRQPRRFRVVDIATRVVLAEDAGARDTLAVLRDVRSTVDVEVFVWESERERWRLLTLGEQRTLWDRRHSP